MEAEHEATHPQTSLLRTCEKLLTAGAFGKRWHVIHVFLKCLNVQ